MRRLSGCFALISAIALAGCVTQTPTHVPLQAEARSEVASTEIVAPIRQSEIYVYVPPTTAGQNNGLIGALIDAGVDAYRANTAETDVKSLRDAVVDMDFDRAWRDQLQTSLSNVPWTHLEGVRVVKEVPTPAVLDGVITGSKDAAVMIANSDYHLSNDGADLYIVVNVDLYAHSPALTAFKPANGDAKVVSAPANSIYRNSFMFHARAPGALGRRNVNMAAWAANHGAAFRASMDLGMKELGAMIAADVQRDDAPASEADPRAKPHDESLGRDADGELIRQPDGSLVYNADVR